MLWTNTRYLLIPVKFQNLDKELVDANVIAGHVVPDVLLFTRPLSKIEQKTATYTEKPSSIKVTAVIQIQDNNGMWIPCMSTVKSIDF